MSRSGLDKPWARSGAAGMVRELLLLGVLGPLIDLHTRARVLGREHLTGLQPPVVFVANHSSHMDTPVILRALPSAWRRRTAVAAAADYFYRVPRLAHAVSLAFNTVPVERKGEGSEAASGLARLIGEGWNLLLFAEGTRSRDGTVGRLHSGAAVLAAEHRLAIVPVHVSGTHAVMPRAAGGCGARVAGSRSPSTSVRRSGPERASTGRRSWSGSGCSSRHRAPSRRRTSGSRLATRPPLRSCGAGLRHRRERLHRRRAGRSAARAR